MQPLPTPKIDANIAVDGLPERTDGKNPVANDMQSNTPTVREQDRYMPIANVIRIMRKVLPSHGKISDDAKETVQECVSEFISFITGEANDRCQREQRKTITAEDVLWAMNKLGFDDYIDPLSTYLIRYREQEGDHRGSSLRSEPPPCLIHKRHAVYYDLPSYGRANFNPPASDGYDGATTSGSDAVESKRSF